MVAKPDPWLDAGPRVVSPTPVGGSLLDALPRVLGLGLAGSVLLAVTWAIARPRGGRVPRWLAVPWTLLLAEILAGWVSPDEPVEAPDWADRVPQDRRQLSGWSVPEDLLWRRPEAEQPRTPVVWVGGDSFVYGQGVRRGETLPARLEAALLEQRVSTRVLNLGEPGRSFFDVAAREAIFSRGAAPDVIVHVFVLNDLGLAAPGKTGSNWTDFIREARSTSSPSRLWAMARSAWLSRQLERQTERAYRDALRADTAPWGAFEETLDAAVERAEARGARYVFAVYPLLHDLEDYPFEAEHQRLLEAAERAGAEAVDLLPAFRGLDERRLWVHPADHHPNAVAHEAAARRLAAAVSGQPVKAAAGGVCEGLRLFDPVGDVGDVCADPTGEAAWRAAIRLRDAPSRGFDARPVATEALARDLLLTVATGGGPRASEARVLLSDATAPRGATSSGPAHGEAEP